jgi:hypothetical protein
LKFRALAQQNSILTTRRGSKEQKRPCACLFSHNFGCYCSNTIKEIEIPFRLVIGRVAKFLAPSQKLVLKRSASFDNDSVQFIDSIPEIVEKYQNWVSEDKYMILNRIQLRTFKSEVFAVKCSNRGNDVYRFRVKRRFNGLASLVKETIFFNPKDRNENKNTKALIKTKHNSNHKTQQTTLKGEIIQEHTYFMLSFVRSDVVHLKNDVWFNKLSNEQIKSVEKFLEQKN